MALTQLPSGAYVAPLEAVGLLVITDSQCTTSFSILLHHGGLVQAAEVPHEQAAATCVGLIAMLGVAFMLLPTGHYILPGAVVGLRAFKNTRETLCGVALLRGGHEVRTHVVPREYGPAVLAALAERVQTLEPGQFIPGEEGAA